MPELETERLWLRPFEISDAETVQRLLDDPDVAAAIPIPHPLPKGAADAWITYIKDAESKGKEITFGLIRKTDITLVGSVSLLMFTDHRKAELGYWIGRQFWGKEYAPEACRKVVEYGFTNLKLHRMYSTIMTSNLNSIRVVEKLGFRHEGTLRESFLTMDGFKNLELYGMLQMEYKELEPDGVWMQMKDGAMVKYDVSLA